MIEKHTLTREQKLEYWGDGPWVNEPDLIEFEHAGFKCLIDRKCGPSCLEPATLSIFGGYLCGYIELPDDHSWAKNENVSIMDAFIINISVHGGITWIGRLSEERPFMVGFDCAHTYDLVPSKENMDNIMCNISPEFKEIKEKQKIFQSNYKSKLAQADTYRSISYVIEQCKSLAEQAKGALT